MRRAMRFETLENRYSPSGFVQVHHEPGAARLAEETSVDDAIDAFVDAGANTYGGQVVVNPSGGLISKGHPLGATGLAQCAELNWQLRGQAERRQVDGAEVALQHNLGLGGAAVVAMYRKGAFSDRA